MAQPASAVTARLVSAFGPALSRTRSAAQKSCSRLDAYSAFFTKTADAIRQAGAFGQPEQWRFDWDQPYTRDEWLDQVPTSGGHTLFPPATLQELLTGLGAAIDAAGGGFTVHYTTVAVTAARTDAA